MRNQCRSKDCIIWTQSYFPDVASRGGSFAVPALAEAYLNFGFLGIWGILLCAGVACGVADRYARRNVAYGRAILFYAAFVCWLPSMVRVDFASWFKEYAEYWLVVLQGVFLIGSVLSSLRTLAPPVEQTT